MEGDKIEDMPPFILDIYDKDLISDDFIARSVIKIKDATFSEDNIIPKPTWHPCKMTPNSPT